MNSTWPPFAGWLLHSALGGGMLLLLALPMMRACRQPAWRQRLGESALLAALALGIFNFGPSWITVPLLSPESFLSPAAAQPSARVSESLPPSGHGIESIAQSEAEAGGDQPDQDGAIAFDEAAFDRMLAQLDGDAPNGDAEPRNRAGETSQPAFRIGSRWLSFAVVAYAGASLCLLGRWVLGYCVLWRLLRNAQPAPEPIRQLFDTMARGRRRRPRLLVSRRLRVPMSCGILRPCVVVPASFCEADAAGALRWLFAHELTHLERGDAWTCLLFGLGQVLYFCLPWFWWLRRQVRLCQEYVADAAAAEQAANPEDYAQFLVSLTRAPAVPLGALGVFGNSSDLFRRVTMLLQDPMHVEKRCPRWWSLATAGGLLGLAVVVSGIGLRADAAQGERTTDTVVRVADETEPADPRKQEGATEARKARKVIVIEDKEQADPKDPAKKPAVEKVLRDLEELLKDLPAAVDADQIKQLQEQLKKSQREMERAFEKLKEVDPSKLDAFREHLRQFQGSGFFVTDEAQRKALEAMPGHAQWFYSNAALSGGRLGVAIQAPGTVLADQLDLPKGEGLVIEKVAPDSAAAKAGLKPHDVVLQFNGKPVPNAPAKFIKMVEEVKANTPVDAVVLRKGKKVTVEVSLSEAKAKQEQQFQFKIAPDSVKPFMNQRPNTGREGSGAGSGTGSGTGRHGVITTITRTNDSFTTRYQEGSLIITVTGTVADSKSKVKHIEIQDGGKHETYNSADKVPEQYRSKVKNLIEMSEKNNVKIEVGANSQGTSSGGPVMITLDKGSAASLGQALSRMLPQLCKNPIRLILPGSEPVRMAGSADTSEHSPGDPNHTLTLTVFGNTLRADCDDPHILSMVRELSRLVTQADPREGDFEVIKLKKAQATEAAKILDEAFNGNKMNQQQRRETTIRVVADPTTNSLLVRAKPLDMLQIRKLVQEVIDNDGADLNHVIRNWKIGPLKHASAKDIYLLIKDVYKEHINNALEMTKSGALKNGYFYGPSLNPNVDQNGQPRGVDLTVSYDDKTNSVFLSCNEIIYGEVKKLVEDADQRKVDSNNGY